ncbi:hypothetical protein JCM21714_4765 [Gracilibacillus boraciitolerans JCM 21714]|uniref:Uncharacterized protein n=1 Tax=Gracilibacillus boraciitolerans JCM 21714 TaxID=1298598 RepID=W4VQZ6_9BACI|nr:hypothetical protein JCM21714_4765 [Gracilibacillus boraciitolerans JCM 21714]
MKKAGSNGLLTIEEAKDHRNNKPSYRLRANREALETLGVEPDNKARSQLNHRLPKNGRAWSDAHYDRAYNNQAILRAADRRGGVRTGLQQGKELWICIPK